MQISPLTKVLVACLGLVLGLSVLIAKLPGSEGEIQGAAELEARLAEKMAAAADPASRHRKVMRLMVWDREFERLERIVAASRRKETAEGEDYLDLFDFYKWTGRIATRNDDLYWQMHLDHLTAWKEAHPDSITPRVALANFWTGYAWKARGGDYAYTVTEDEWKLFHERLLNAQEVLNETPAELRMDAHYFVERLTVALGLGLSKREALEWFRAGVEVDYEYYPIYDSIVIFFLPRWYGDPGEVGRMIQEEVSRLGGERADWALTRMVWSLYSHEKEGIFEDHGIDYPMLKKVYEKWTSQWEDVETANYYCLYACIAGDRKAAKRMFDRIGEEFDEYCWGSEENFRKWKRRYG